jgi:hypothetical protein
VHHHVEATVLGHDLRDGGVDRRLRRHIHLDRAQVDALFARFALHVGHAGSVTAQRFAHAGVNGMPGMGQGTGAHQAEAAGRAGYDNDVVHEGIS